MTLYRVKNRPFFNSFFNEFLDEENHKKDCNCRPATNIIEEDDKFVLELAVPGLKKENFNINLDDKLLTVYSDVEGKEGEEKTYNRKEFAYDNFSRSFTIPKSVDNEKIGADYDNGILRITLPKKPEEAKIKKQIAIN